MPVYTLLGASGSTGSAILRCLLEEPPKDLQLQIMARSKAKLLKIFPDLENKCKFPLKIVEGTPDHHDAMRLSLGSADVIFQCIAAKVAKPGASLCYDTTRHIIEALTDLRDEQPASYKIPTVLVLRAAILSKALSCQVPWLVVRLLWFCLYHQYADLEKGTQFLQRKAEETPDLLNYIIVDPPAIHDPNGTTRIGHTLVLSEKQAPNLSYTDLGAGFCELAERRVQFKGKEVGVSATGHVKLTWRVQLGFLWASLKARFSG